MYRRHSFLFLSLAFVLEICSCRQKSRPIQASISFADDRAAIVVKGIDYAILSELRSDTSVAVWQSLLQVYKVPTDTSMKNYQPVQPGKYRLSGNVIEFRPDTPFKQGQPYFARLYNHDQPAGVLEYAAQARRPSSVNYSDINFGY